MRVKKYFIPSGEKYLYKNGSSDKKRISVSTTSRQNDIVMMTTYRTRNKPVVTKTVTRFSIFSINIQNTSFLSFFTFKQTHDALLVKSFDFLSCKKVDSNQSETLKTTVSPLFRLLSFGLVQA